MCRVGTLMPTRIAIVHNQNLQPDGEMMKVFKKDVAAHAAELKQKGYILLKDVLTQDFLNYMKDFHKKSIAGGIDENSAWRITGKKHQYVFPFPSKVEAEEFRDKLAKLTGLKRDSLTISERHLKQYEADAKPYAFPHKDRGASKYSIGLPIHLGPRTSVCVFPNWDRNDNLTDRAVFKTAEDCPDLEATYASKDALLLHEAIGDMIVFHGSSMWHERVHPAGTAVLYIKINDDGRDPLGENIYGGATATTAKEAMAEAY
jgi:hypothetical protein